MFTLFPARALSAAATSVVSGLGLLMSVEDICMHSVRLNVEGIELEDRAHADNSSIQVQWAQLVTAVAVHYSTLPVISR